ncbi:hypothetical protein ABIB30_000532 [Pedobacter sp. UYP1]
MKKIIKVPTSLIGCDAPQNSLMLDGCSVSSSAYIVRKLKEQCIANSIYSLLSCKDLLFSLMENKNIS